MNGAFDWLDGNCGHGIRPVPVMISGFQMKFRNVNKGRLALVVAFPALFLTTLILLNSRLGENGGRPRLVAAHHHNLQTDKEGRVLRFRSVNLLDTGDPLEKSYDEAKLQMLGQVNTKEDEKIRDDGNDKHAFNELISSRLSLNRALPDSRHSLCEHMMYPRDLPKASIIICFYNEAWSTLLRTVHSILNRTPARLLYEIVLVDDASELGHLQGKLAQYLWNLHPDIKLLRLPERQGLIKARLYGAHAATGEVLVFLDSHCEVNVNWLEPLLTRVSSRHTTIAIPVIDIINHNTFEYKASRPVRGGFNWGMHFTWDPLPKDHLKNEGSYTQPIETPTMAGGLFAVNRKYFWDMGGYDKELDTWGGENLEMSFRIWLCGGKLEIIPCSRVGHVFRDRRPYGTITGENTMLRNSVRVARVWLDDYIQYFFQVQPAAASVDYGDITDRLELKKTLKCKPFNWYLKYIYPEQVIPDGKHKAVDPRKNVEKFVPKVKARGVIKNMETGLCLTAEDSSPKKGTRVILTSCDQLSTGQVWNETEENELSLTAKLCLDVNDHREKVTYVRLMKCHGQRGGQAWVWSIKNMVYQLYNPTSGKCLIPLKEEDVYYLTVDICSSNKISAFKMEKTS